MDWSQIVHPQFWFTVLEIIVINLLLSGDNAVVIALACRKLPSRQRRVGMVLGAGVASVLRIVFAGVAAYLMRLPYLQLVGGILLLWIAVKLLLPDDEHVEGSVEAVADLWRAVRIVVIADVVMSLDNVVAVAAAAKDSFLLLAFGLCVSIPMVIAGAALITTLLERFPSLVWAGAALLGWVAGGLLVGDTVVVAYLGPSTLLTFAIAPDLLRSLSVQPFSVELDLARFACGVLGVAVVLLLARSLRARSAAAAETHEPTAKP